MKKENNVRQLAAVMFTDMIGYTALMQEDEQKARKNRDRHREVLERLIRENQGNILQYFGDGTLSVFDSAINAVKCALEIQTELQKEPAIPVRIGLNVGDIVYEEDGVYGDAVNVAARIEAISIPGAVLFSDKVFDDIKNHPEFSSVSLGEFDKAFYHLEKALEARLGGMIFLRNSPAFKEFRQDPRYKTLMKKIGLETDCHLSIPKP
ncbi:adenylate/guanylate cyclase domain-containing protein [Acidobacteriota bacterium]